MKRNRAGRIALMGLGLLGIMALAMPVESAERMVLGEYFTQSG
jgi:hypothetical protein